MHRIVGPPGVLTFRRLRPFCPPSGAGTCRLCNAQSAINETRRQMHDRNDKENEDPGQAARSNGPSATDGKVLRKIVESGDRSSEGHGALGGGDGSGEATAGKGTIDRMSLSADDVVREIKL